MPVLVIALVAGCGSTHTSAPKPVARSRPVPSVRLTASQEVQECAALDMVRMGFDTYDKQVQVVAGQYSTSQADAELIIAKAIHDRCPSEVSVVPAGAPLP